MNVQVEGVARGEPRLVLLPALPANAVQKAVVAAIVPASLGSLRVKGRVVCYIRHPSTVNLLKKYFPDMEVMDPGREYKWDGGDVLVLVGLKHRPKPGEEARELSEGDLAVVVVSPR